jgi:hypothetical protein
MIGRCADGSGGRRGVAGRSVAVGSAVVLSAVALACSGAAPGTAAPLPDVRVATASAPMTAGSATATTTAVACPAGTRLVGGGMWTGRADPNDPAVPINGLRAKGTFPSDGDGNPLRASTADLGLWSATGNFGGQSETGDQVTSLALCATKKFRHRVVAVASTAGPTGTQSVASATATCPAGTTAVGGGALATPAGSTSLKPIGSYPGTADGAMVADGTLNPASWTAVGSSGGNGDPAAVTTAFAVCARPQGGQIRVTRVDGPGPRAGSTAVTIGATCADGVLTGGGVYVDSPSGPLQGGVHLRGSYPSDAAGTPASGRTVNPSTWSGIVAAGGSSPGITAAHAFALCADQHFTADD